MYVPMPDVRVSIAPAVRPARKRRYVLHRYAPKRAAGDLGRAGGCATSRVPNRSAIERACGEVSRRQGPKLKGFDPRWIPTSIPTTRWKGWIWVSP